MLRMVVLLISCDGKTISETDWLKCILKGTLLLSVKQGHFNFQCQLKLGLYKPHPTGQQTLLKASCELRLNADILDSNHIIILSWQNEITQSLNKWPQQNAEKAVGCAKLADTTHYMVLQSWHSGKWEIWWGALEQWLEWQNAPKAPASSNEAAWCSNQVHWAQEGPDVARTLTHSFQHSLRSPFSPSAATKHSQYLATGKRTDTLCTWIIIVPLVNWRYFSLSLSKRK